MAYSWICDKHMWNGRRVLLGAFSSTLGPGNQRRPVWPGTDDRAGVIGHRPLPGRLAHHRPRGLGLQAGGLNGQGRPAVLQPEPG